MTRRWGLPGGQVERFDLYVRISLYLFGLVVPLFMVGLLQGSRTADGPTIVVVTAGLVQGAVGVVLIHSGVKRWRESRPQSRWLIGLAGGLTVVFAVVAVAVLERDEAGGITVLCVLSYLTALSIVVNRRTFVIATLALTVVPPLVSLAWSAAVSPPMRLTWLIVMTLGSVSVWCAGRGSLWMLGIVRELDRARGVQSRLAVAEERLRFSRDLHDVVGRGLSVVALKSELAARLAERADPRAAGEMLEVGRVAQDLLTEVREVARGYRTVDLDAELAGARSVLAAAGIECRTLGEAGDLPADVQTTLGWVVREGTTNVLRHSDARSCTISVRRDGSGPVVLTMENDGVREARGPESPRLGSGLLGLSERLTALGGSVGARSLPPQRFRLTAHVPVGEP